MPYRKYNRSKRRRIPSRSRFKRKRYNRSGNTRVKRGMKVTYFKRSGSTLYNLNVATTYVPAPNPGNELQLFYSWRFASLPDSTDFSNLYDQFRLKALKVNFIPVANMSEFSAFTGATGTTAPVYSVRSYSAVDQNNDNVVISIDDLRQYENMKWRPYNRIHSRYYRPRVAMQMIGGYQAMIPGKQPWLDISGSVAPAANADHWGLYFNVDPTQVPNGTVLYQIEWKAYFQCRNVK